MPFLLRCTLVAVTDEELAGLMTGDDPDAVRGSRERHHHDALLAGPGEIVDRAEEVGRMFRRELTDKVAPTK